MNDVARLRLGRASVAAGLALLLGAGGLCLWNMREAMTADERATAIAAALASDISSQTPSSLETDSEEMPTREVDGVAYIGVLSLPEQDLELPIAAEWSYDQLESSPCRLCGSYLRGDLVICAHNYYHHFWPLLGMGMGGEVYLRAVDGSVYRYVVSNRETLRPDQMDYLADDAQDSWDLSLSTCTWGGQSRCVVRCTRT